MKIKNITDFTIEECRTYLEQNPNGPLTKDVQSRLNFLLDEIVTLEEKERQAKIAKQDELSKIEWIDVNQFLEAKHYKKIDFIIHNPFIKISFAIMTVLWLLFAIFVNHDEAGPILLFLSILSSMILCYFVMSIFFVLQIIYNVEKNNYKDNEFVIVQNRSGEMGICRCDKHRLVSLLSMNFTKIYHCGEDAYIVMMDEKFGVFNATLRKMVIPVIYDNIEIEGKDCLLAIKNNVGSRFTTKGYRIVS